MKTPIKARKLSTKIGVRVDLGGDSVSGGVSGVVSGGFSDSGGVSGVVSGGFSDFGGVSGTEVSWGFSIEDPQVDPHSGVPDPVFPSHRQL